MFRSAVEKRVEDSLGSIKTVKTEYLYHSYSYSNSNFSNQINNESILQI
jgi:hypothetical protein